MGKSRKQHRAGDKTPIQPPEPTTSPVIPSVPTLPLANITAYTAPPAPQVAPNAPAESPAAAGADRRAEAPVHVPAEVPVHVPAEAPVHVPAEAHVHVPAEVPVHVPAEAPVHVPAEVLTMPVEAETVAATAASTTGAATAAASAMSSALPDVPGVPAEVIDSCGESPAPKLPTRVQFQEPAAHDFVSAPRFSTDTTASTRGPTPARAEDKKTIKRSGRDGTSAKRFVAKELSALLQTLKQVAVWFLTDPNPRLRVARLILLCVFSLNLAHLITRLRGTRAIKA